MKMMGPHPWLVSFPYGRALQAPELDALQETESDMEPVQQRLFEQCRSNGLAPCGMHTGEKER